MQKKSTHWSRWRKRFHSTSRVQEEHTFVTWITRLEGGKCTQQSTKSFFFRSDRKEKESLKTDRVWEKSISFSQSSLQTGLYRSLLVCSPQFSPPEGLVADGRIIFSSMEDTSCRRCFGEYSARQYWTWKSLRENDPNHQQQPQMGLSARRQKERRLLAFPFKEETMAE